MVRKQNTQNIYHKQMNNGVEGSHANLSNWNAKNGQHMPRVSL